MFKKMDILKLCRLPLQGGVMKFMISWTVL